MERLTYTIEEAGELLGLSRNNSYNLARSGSLPTIKLGKRLLVPKAALARMLESAGTKTSL
jgi:excisionase family DNA binding protein